MSKKANEKGTVRYEDGVVYCENRSRLRKHEEDGVDDQQVRVGYHFSDPKTETGKEFLRFLAVRYLNTFTKADTELNKALAIYGKPEDLMSDAEFDELDGKVFPLDLDELASKFFNYRANVSRSGGARAIPQEFKTACNDIVSMLKANGKDADQWNATLVKKIYEDTTHKAHKGVKAKVDAARKRLKGDSDEFEL